jgi:hypothetical protein|tara:strand:+ start:131 stop:385 length:255 start_codon:yes stop_codon:yes gene_type:complete
VSDFEEVKAVVRLNPDGSMTRVERTPPRPDGEGSPSKDPMTLLLMAYRIMVNSPECKSLLEPLMDLIKQKERIMTQRNNPTEGY